MENLTNIIMNQIEQALELVSNDLEQVEITNIKEIEEKLQVVVDGVSLCFGYGHETDYFSDYNNAIEILKDNEDFIKMALYKRIIVEDVDYIENYWYGRKNEIKNGQLFSDAIDRIKELAEELEEIGVDIKEVEFSDIIENIKEQSGLNLVEKLEEELTKKEEIKQVKKIKI